MTTEGSSDERDVVVGAQEQGDVPIMPHIDPSQSAHRRRGATRLRDFTLSRICDEKISIEFDRFWHPIGPNAARYRSFVGVLARNKPSILAMHWKEVDEQVKKHIWETIQVKYLI